jgi:hypothetical protein
MDFSPITLSIQSQFHQQEINHLKISFKRFFLRFSHMHARTHTRKKLIKEVMKKKCTYFIFFSLFLYFSLLNMLVNYKSCDWREKSNDYHRTSIEFNIITETEYLQFRRKIRVCQMIFSRSERTEYLELSLVCESEREKIRKMYIIFRESAIAVGKCFLQFHGV